MKEGWEYGTINDFCTINYGTRVVRRNVTGDKYPVYGGGGETFRMDEYNREDCLVVSRFAMSKQCTRIVKGKFFLNDSGLTVSPKDSSSLSSKLLDRYLLASNDLIYSCGRGSAQLNLNVDEFKKIPLSYPISLEEQQSIVEYLDSAFAKIDAMKANAEKALNEAKALFQASLKEMLKPKEGWEEKRIDEVCSIARGGSPRPIKDYITTEPNGLNWIKIGDTDMGGKYIYSTKEKIRPEGLKKSRWVEENEFLLSNSMSFGRPYILKTNGCIHDGWLVLRDYQKYLNIDFFYYVLSSDNVQRQFHVKAQGSTVSNLNTDRVASVTIPVPTLTEQQSIVETLDSLKSKVDHLQANYEKISKECDALKQAVLRQVFE